MNPASGALPCQFATFRVDGLALGIDVLEVQEVLRGQRLTPVPLASPEVAGLINLRGQIVPALEMRQLLRLPPRPPEVDALSIVVRTAHGAVSLQVDEIGDVLELDPATFEPIPIHVDAQIRHLLLGVHKLKHRLLLVLNPRLAADLVDARTE
jgi:purine-binding chemotaxis protein CheW